MPVHDPPDEVEPVEVADQRFCDDNVRSQALDPLAGRVDVVHHSDERRAQLCLQRPLVCEANDLLVVDDEDANCRSGHGNTVWMVESADYGPDAIRVGEKVPNGHRPGPAGAAERRARRETSRVGIVRFEC